MSKTKNTLGNYEKIRMLHNIYIKNNLEIKKKLNG